VFGARVVCSWDGMLQLRESGGPFLVFSVGAKKSPHSQAKVLVHQQSTRTPRYRYIYIIESLALVYTYTHTDSRI